MKLAWDANKGKASGKYQRVRSDDLYHTSRWTKLAKEFKQSHPLCERCKAQGLIVAAEVVDHIIPFPVCQDFFDRNNLQSLCSHCNIAKGNEDKKLIQEWKLKNQSK